MNLETAAFAAALSPAQKAWATRRAIAAGTASPVALRAAAPVAHADGMTAGQKAAATRKANLAAAIASGAVAAPVAKAAPASAIHAEGMTAGQKAAATRKARLAALVAGAAGAAKAEAPAAKAKREIVERVGALVEGAAELTAGQKAVEKARADLEALRKGVETPSPVDAVAVTMFVDDRAIGAGQRQFLVIEIGARVVTLFSVAHLAEIQVDRLTFDRHAKAYAAKVHDLQKRLDSVVANFDRANRDYDVWAVSRAQKAIARAVAQAAKGKAKPVTLALPAPVAIAA